MTAAVETASAPSKLRNQQEYLLQGSIVDDAVEHLLHRLRGLCDNADSGYETFHDQEFVYVMRSAATSQSVSVRVRRSVEPKDKDMPWHMRYLGQQEVGDKNRATLVRSCVNISCSNNVSQFLQEMGFKLDFEYLSKGYIFKKGRMKVIVAKISRTEPLEHVSNSYLVELSVVAPSGQDGLADEVRAFAEQLKPLVTLEKVDPRRLQQA